MICNYTYNYTHFCYVYCIGTSAVVSEQSRESDQCQLCGQDSPPSRKGGQLINWIDCDACKNWFHL